MFKTLVACSGLLILGGVVAALVRAPWIYTLAPYPFLILLLVQAGRNDKYQSVALGTVLVSAMTGVGTCFDAYARPSTLKLTLYDVPFMQMELMNAVMFGISIHKANQKGANKAAAVDGGMPALSESTASGPPPLS
jgi:hypothetical protein